MPPQTSFRLPGDLARALARAARERGVSKSRIVREALEQYLAAPALPVTTIRERSAPYIASVRLRRERDDDTARLIRQHNWRD